MLAQKSQKQQKKKLLSMGYDIDEVIMELQKNLLQGNLTLPEGLKKETFADD